VRPCRRCAVSALLLLAALVFPALGLASHVKVSGEVRAELGERISPSQWRVVISWEVKCEGDSWDQAYYGSLALLDLDTGERIYLGGVSSATGVNDPSIERRTQTRRLVPYLKISCSLTNPADGETHSDGPIELTGTAVLVPARESGGGGGGGSGGGGPGGGSGAPDGFPTGACAQEVRGTSGSETIVGTAAAENVFALAGNDVVRGRNGHDCLRGGSGNDRLDGEGGNDALYGGGGADVLSGGPGRNLYEGGGGNDTIRAANGRAETVACGPGIDTARVDRVDTVRGCERVVRA
jgi:hypothetical protein